MACSCPYSHPTQDRICKTYLRNTLQYRPARVTAAGIPEGVLFSARPPEPGSRLWEPVSSSLERSARSARRRAAEVAAARDGRRSLGRRRCERNTTNGRTTPDQCRQTDRRRTRDWIRSRDRLPEVETLCRRPAAHRNEAVGRCDVLSVKKTGN